MLYIVLALVLNVCAFYVYHQKNLTWLYMCITKFVLKALLNTNQRR